MSDDISKKITIDVEVNTDGQQQINQYKTAFDSFRNSISSLSNPLAGLSNSISTLDKDISKLTTSVDKLNTQNQYLNSGGNKVKGVVTDLITSFTTWNGIIEILEISVDGLEAALTGGLAILTTFLPQIISWVGELFKGNATLTALNKTLKDNKIVMDAVNQAKLQGTQNAQQELVHLKLLYNAIQNHNLSLMDRKKLIKELQSQYPGYFGNLSSETILAGKAASSYKELANSIVATSRARAAEDMIADNNKRQLGNEQKIAKLKTDLDNKQKELDKAQNEHEEILKANENAPSTFGIPVGDPAGDVTVDRLTDERDALKKAFSDLTTDSKLLDRQNRALVKTITENIKNSGAQAVTGLKTANDQQIKFNEKSLKDKQVYFNEAEKTRNESLTRQLQTTYEAYGSETAAENDHYQDELERLKKLLSDKKITREEYNKVSAQLEDEHHSNIAAIINKYNAQDKERAEQANNELHELQIKGMHEGAAKQIAELQQEQKEKNQQFDKLDAESLARVNKLATEISDARNKDPRADTSELAKQLDAEYQVMAINCKKQEALERQTADAISKIKGREGQDKKEDADQKEIEQQKDKQINELADKFTKQKNDKAKKAAEELKNFELQQEKKLSEEAFSIISQSIKQEADAKIAGLERDKEAELNNSSLTSAQKLAIEQKFKQQEAQVKIKAFKEEQEASIAQAVINGALAITKATAQSGVLSPLVVPAIIAETAVEIAKIAAQKPPAYASGGLHYNSDGKGGVLNGYSRTDNTNAWLRSGEGIVVSEAMRVPWARNLVSAINVGFGGRDFSITNPGRGYAVGGIFTDGGDANRYYNQPVHDQKNLANSIAYQMINNFPPVYVDVKDINNQQNILAQTINRVNL